MSASATSFRGQYRRALDVLDKMIEDAMPLFQGEAWVMEERRLACLYRIDLLRESDHLTEALAWACLEVEANPDNVAAVALKERLKREAGFLKRRTAGGEKPADENRSAPLGTVSLECAASKPCWNAMSFSRCKSRKSTRVIG